MFQARLAQEVTEALSNRESQIASASMRSLSLTAGRDSTIDIGILISEIFTTTLEDVNIALVQSEGEPLRLKS